MDNDPNIPAGRVLIDQLLAEELHRQRGHASPPNAVHATMAEERVARGKHSTRKRTRDAHNLAQLHAGRRMSGYVSVAALDAALN